MNNSFLDCGGFTLVECILALLIMTEILLLFSLLIPVMKQTQTVMNRNSEKEFGVFLLQLERELDNCRFRKVAHNVIYLESGQGQEYKYVEIRQVGSRVDKREGTQPLLTDIKKFSVHQTGHAVEIEVTFNDGIQCEGQWILPREP